MDYEFITEETFIHLKECARQDLPEEDDLKDLDSLAKWNDKLISVQYNWVEVWTKQHALIEFLQMKMDECYGILYEEYKYGKNTKYVWDKKNEIESQIKRDKRYTEKMEIFLEQNYYLTFLTEYLQLIKNTQFSIQRRIDIKKTMMGMY